MYYCLNKLSVAQQLCHDHQMTYKKLQATMYYLYAWGLVFFNDDEQHLTTKLFPAQFHAGIHGAREQTITKVYQSVGYYNIETPPDPKIVLNNDLADLFEQVDDAYIKDYSGLNLERIQHEEFPYQQARLQPDHQFNDILIYQYFNDVMHGIIE